MEQFIEQMQHQAAAPAAYPGFALTEAGLARLHQLVGKLLHESLETAAALAQARAEAAQGRRLLAEVQARHAPPADATGEGD